MRPTVVLLAVIFCLSVIYVDAHGGRWWRDGRWHRSSSGKSSGKSSSASKSSSSNSGSGGKCEKKIEKKIRKLYKKFEPECKPWGHWGDYVEKHLSNWADKSLEEMVERCEEKKMKWKGKWRKKLCKKLDRLLKKIKECKGDGGATEPPPTDPPTTTTTPEPIPTTPFAGCVNSEYCLADQSGIDYPKLAAAIQPYIRRLAEDYRLLDYMEEPLSSFFGLDLAADNTGAAASHALIVMQGGFNFTKQPPEDDNELLFDYAPALMQRYDEELNEWESTREASETWDDYVTRIVSASNDRSMALYADIMNLGVTGEDFVQKFLRATRSVDSGSRTLDGFDQGLIDEATLALQNLEAESPKLAIDALDLAWTIGARFFNRAILFMSPNWYANSCVTAEYSLAPETVACGVLGSDPNACPIWNPNC